MDYINIGCDYCNWRGVCMRKSRKSCLGGHMRHCKEYLETSHSNKRRAINPSVEVVLNNFTIEQAEEQIERHELGEDFYDFDWEQEKNCLQDRYDIQYGSDQINLRPNMDAYMFQLRILALTSKDSDTTPIRTGWIRAGSTDNVTHANWEDYVMINRFIVKNNLTLESGDELLKLIQELCTRHSIVLNLPRTMRSIK